MIAAPALLAASVALTGPLAALLAFGAAALAVLGVRAVWRNAKGAERK